MLYLLHGENDFESWSEKESMINDFKKKNSDCEIEIYDDQDLIEKRIDVSAYGFFSKPKLYVFKRFFSINKNDREQVFKNIENFEASDIIIWEDSKADKRSKIYKSIKKKGVEREFSLLKGVKLDRWIKKEIESHKLKINSDIIELLKYRFGSNQWIIKNEINKLAIYLHKSRRNIIEKDDHFIISTLSTIDMWEFSHKFFSKNKKGALSFLDRTNFEKSDEILLIGTLASQLRNIFLIKKVGNYNMELLTKKLRIHPYALKKSAEYTVKFSLERLEKLYNQLLNLDYSIKQGKIEAKLGLSLLIASL